MTPSPPKRALSGLLNQEYWNLMKEIEDPKTLHERLYRNFENASNLSSMISGFTFFVLYQTPQAQNNEEIGILKEICVLSLIASFSISIIGTAISGVLLHFWNKMADDNIDVLKQFIGSFNFWLDLPSKLNIVSMIFMEISCVSSVSCIYPFHISLLMWMFGAVSFLIGIYIDLKMRLFVRDVAEPNMRNKLKQM